MLLLPGVSVLFDEYYFTNSDSDSTKCSFTSDQSAKKQKTINQKCSADMVNSGNVQIYINTLN